MAEKSSTESRDEETEETIACDLSFIGCKEKFLPRDFDEHMQQNSAKHTTMMASAIRELQEKVEGRDRVDGEKNELGNDDVRELKQKLQEMEEKLQRELGTSKEKDEQLIKVNGELCKLKQKLQEKDETHAAEVTALKKKLQEIDNQIIAGQAPPYDLTVTNVKRLMECGRWNSGNLYTHPGGYGFYVEMKKRRDHYESPGLAVNLYTHHKGEKRGLPNDNTLTFTIELRNQHKDQGHMTVTQRIQWDNRRAYTEHVFSKSFIPWDDMQWNERQQTQYLRNDCLQFRITKIQVDQL